MRCATPTFRDLAGTTRYTGDGFPMQNLNRLLDLYPGADGVKIGFTDAAQKTIVASAVHDGHRVYVSLMHSQDLVGDCTRLFDWVWDIVRLVDMARRYFEDFLEGLTVDLGSVDSPPTALSSSPAPTTRSRCTPTRRRRAIRSTAG